jgi:hypothetical protein
MVFMVMSFLTSEMIDLTRKSLDCSRDISDIGMPPNKKGDRKHIKDNRQGKRINERQLLIVECDIVGKNGYHLVYLCFSNWCAVTDLPATYCGIRDTEFNVGILGGIVVEHLS